jgi:transitional endoplasmic reticulum ATPase
MAVKNRPRSELEVPKSQEEQLREEALVRLAEIGGGLHTDDDIVFTGTKYILPANATLESGISFLQKRLDDEENLVEFTKVFPYRPHDGARATRLAIKEFAGFTLGKTLYTFFGRQLPQLIDIKTGPGQDDTEQVPWGAMQIPGLSGATLHLGSARDPELGVVFSVTVEAPRKWRRHLDGLFKLIEKHLRENSIYKGKAIDGGENFIDVDVIDPADFVFTESVTRRLEGDVWCFIRHSELLATLGQDGKFAALLEGPYGTGKTGAAMLTAQIAVANGWTFLMCRPGRDNLVTTLEMARMYQPAVVFAEDVDTMAGPQSGNTIERHLDMLDGIKAKGLRLLTIFTTNHAEDIHKGMLRPGRIGAVISIGAMDRPGIEQLGRRVIATLDEDVDWDEVYRRCEGYMPAFVREVFDRSVRYSITLNNGRIGAIGTEAICLAADALRDQYRLMEGASEERVDVHLSAALGEVIQKAVHGTRVVDGDGDYRYELASNGS